MNERAVHGCNIRFAQQRLITAALSLDVLRPAFWLFKDEVCRVMACLIFNHRPTLSWRGNAGNDVVYAITLLLTSCFECRSMDSVLVWQPKLSRSQRGDELPT